MTIGHPQIYEKYRIDSGSTIPKFGTTEYSVITDGGDGFAYLTNGNHLATCEGTSHENVGMSVDGSGDTFIPAKWIRAENGDILLDAPQGTIYLRAKNIFFDAQSADPDGNIFFNASNDIYIKSTDNVTITGTNVTVTATKTATLVGQAFTNIGANFTSVVDTTDIIGAITSLDERLIEVLDFIGLK